MLKSRIRNRNRLSRYDQNSETFLYSWKSQFQLAFLSWLLVNAGVLGYSTFEFLRHSQTKSQEFGLVLVVLLLLVFSSVFFSLLSSLLVEIIARVLNYGVVFRSSVVLILQFIIFIFLAVLNPNQLALYVSSQSVFQFSEKVAKKVIFPMQYFIYKSRLNDLSSNVNVPVRVVLVQSEQNFGFYHNNQIKAEQIARKKSKDNLHTQSMVSFLKISAQNDAFAQETGCTLFESYTHGKNEQKPLKSFFAGAVSYKNDTEENSEVIQREHKKVVFLLRQLSLSPFLQSDLSDLFFDEIDSTLLGTNDIAYFGRLVKKIDKKCLSQTSNLPATFVLKVPQSRLENFWNTLTSRFPSIQVFLWKPVLTVNSNPVVGEVSFLPKNKETEFQRFADFGFLLFGKPSFNSEVIEIFPQQKYSCFAAKKTEELVNSFLLCSELAAINSDNGSILLDSPKEFLQLEFLGGEVPLSDYGTFYESKSPPWEHMFRTIENFKSEQLWRQSQKDGQRNKIGSLNLSKSQKEWNEKVLKRFVSQSLILSSFELEKGIEKSFGIDEVNAENSFVIAKQALNFLKGNQE